MSLMRVYSLPTLTTRSGPSAIDVCPVAAGKPLDTAACKYDPTGEQAAGHAGEDGKAGLLWVMRA